MPIIVFFAILVFTALCGAIIAVGFHSVSHQVRLARRLSCPARQTLSMSCLVLDFRWSAVNFEQTGCFGFVLRAETLLFSGNRVMEVKGLPSFEHVKTLFHMRSIMSGIPATSLLGLLARGHTPLETCCC